MSGWRKENQSSVVLLCPSTGDFISYITLLAPESGCCIFGHAMGPQQDALPVVLSAPAPKSQGLQLNFHLYLQY